MTRDDVLESAALKAEEDLLAVPGERVAAADRWDNDSSGKAARRIAASIRALKSQPPEKSPEAARAENTAVLDRTQALGVRLREVEAERDALKAQLEAALAQRTESNLRADEWEVTAEQYRTKLEATERKAAEAIARVEALTAEVKHREWIDKGALMSGEQELCHRPEHLPPHTPQPGNSCYVPPLLEVRVNPAMPPGEAKMVGADGREVRIVGIGDGE